ncbi:MAG: hypothetical protein PVI41_05090 [Roseobacter sp.]|jgi:hypothetical protein
MGPVAAILGGVFGTLSFVIALVFFDTTWSGAMMTYFITASATFGTLLIVCLRFGASNHASHPREETKSSLAFHS